MVPLLPLTRKFLSVSNERLFSCAPAGKESMSFSQNGLSLIPVHQTASPNGTSRTLLPSLSEMTASSFTSLAAPNRH